jgi:hypothetical protein
MSETHAAVLHSPVGASALGGPYDALRRRQPVLAAFTLLMLAAMAPTLTAMALDERTFNGIDVWIKPFKFELSTAVHMATLALFWPYLDLRFSRGRALCTAVWVIVAIFVFEVGYIAYRASLAEASHFNDSTPTAALLYAAMGVAILVVMVITVWIGVQVLRSREGGISPTLRLAIGLGLIVGTLLGTVSGVTMSQHYSHWVGGVASDAGGVPLFGWSRVGGDLRVAHFVGLHAMQGLPLIGWVVQRSPSGRVWVIAAALVWVAVSAAVFSQAWYGKPLLPL